MLVTILLSAALMVALFLLLYAGVALIQDNRFFGSAPKEVRDVIREKPERFPGAHLLGWILGVTAILIFIAAFAVGMIEGGRSGFTFTRYAVRFAVMLYLLKAFDIIVFDRILLCGGRFFPRYYPECAPVLGKHLTLGSAWHLSASPCEVTPSPTLGQHTDEIYKGLLGMSDEELSQLKEEGVI